MIEQFRGHWRRTAFAGVFIALFVGASLFSASLGCSRKKDASRDTLRVALPAGPVTLDPRLAADAVGDKISSLICDGLYRKNDALEMVPHLAERVETLSDTSFRFHLRPNVTFHNGEKLTAEDVVYTYTTIMDGTVASPYRSGFERIAKVEAEAPLVVRLDLKEPYAPLFTMLGRGIVSKKAAEQMGDAFATAPIGTGPYRFVRFVTDSVVELAANPTSFSGVPKTPKLLFDILKDDNIRVLKLIKGDVDLAQNAVPPALVAEVTSKPHLKMKTDPSIIVTYLGLNLTDPVLKKKGVRQALALAIDRDEIIAHQWKGFASKANSILAPENWAYDKSLGQYDYDPKRAAALLDKAGFPDPDGAGPKTRFDLVYKTSTAKERVAIAQMIAHQLAKVGIGVRVEPYEWGTFFRDIKRGNFQVYSLSWVGVTEPDIFYDIAHSSQMPPDGLNRDRYVNADIDRQVSAARVELDPDKRRALYAKVQRILFDELPFIPLWYENNIVLFNDALENVRLRADASFEPLVEVVKK